MSHFTQPRQPKGTPAGGQFASVARPTASLNLTDGALGPEQYAVAVGYARDAARYWCGRLGLTDPDEVTGRALLALLTQHAPRGVRSLRGYVHHLAKGVAMAYQSGGNRSVRRAQAALSAELEERAQASGHWPSAAERAEVAAEVRQRFKVGRRPPADYDTRQVLSLRDSFDDGAPADPPGTPLWASGPLGTGTGPAAGPVPEDTADRVETTLAAASSKERGRARAALRAEAWSMLAPSGPALRPLGAAAVRWARQQVQAGGGAYALARAYLAAEAPEELAEALFAPFQAEAEVDRHKVASLLRRHRAYADDIWAGALKAATRGGACA